MCYGQWVYNETIQPSARYPHFNLSLADKTAAAFIQTACPAQQSMYTCYYSAVNYTRALHVMNTQYIPHDQQSCQAFDAEKLLSRLRNRKLIYLGDSIIAQTWISIFCRLYQSPMQSFVESYNVGFVSFGGGCNPLNCPLGGTNHSALTDGYIKFGKPYDTTIILHIMPRYSAKKTLNEVINNHHTTSQDLVIFNLGVRYNNHDEYHRVMKSFVSDLSELVSKQLTVVPRFFFQQSTPQHFGGDNGYFTPGASKHQETMDSCKVSGHNSSMSSMFDLDWRNRILDRVFEHEMPSNLNIPILHIAKALYSQAIAHVGRTSIEWTAFDCTHWCFPSGAFDYINLVLYNTLRHELPQS